MGSKAFKRIKRGLQQAVTHAQGASIGTSHDKPTAMGLQTFASALDAVASTPAETIHLRARSDLTRALAAMVAREG
jgi:hypothetical protein